jgi:hypothetical protein
MYFINPSHINVNLPQDCDDEDIGMDLLPPPRTSARPTAMSYIVRRIQLAHICREIVDSIPRNKTTDEVPYSDVMRLDQKLLLFIENLPFFFKLDPQSRHQAKVLDAMNPHLSMLRFCITRAAHSRRVKLHQRFVLMLGSDPRYVYSRNACIESAKIIMQFYDGLLNDTTSEHNNPLMISARMGIAMHYMHLALVVLVMDLCVNRGMADEAEIKTVVRDGLKILDVNADKKHPWFERFAQSLKDTLSKHGIALTGSSGEDSTADSDFAAFWESLMRSDPSLDFDAWNSAFSAADMRPL